MTKTNQFHLRVTALSSAVCGFFVPLSTASGNDTLAPIGYTMRSSSQPGGPAFSFVDISASGTRLTFRDADDGNILDADDGVSDPFDLDVLNDGLGFPFFGRIRKSVSMSTNGFLHFTPDGSSDEATNNCPLAPAAAPSDALFVLWDDLVLGNSPSSSGGFVQYFSPCPYSQGGSGDCVVYQWNDADHFGGATDSFDFQAVLYDDGDILLLYGPGNPENGLGSTTGISDAITPDSLTFACDSSNSIPDSSAIFFDYPEPRLQLEQTVTLCSVDGLRGEGGCNEVCGSVDRLVVAPGAQVQFCYRVTNTGTYAVTNHTLTDGVFGGILDDFAFSLPPGESVLITRVAPIQQDVTNVAVWSAIGTFHPVSSNDAATVLVDTDGDGVADIEDRCPGSDDALDADGDGIPDSCDECPQDPAKSAPGTCGCGVPDTDSDDDGAPDCLDGCPSDPGKTAPGACGCDLIDADTDADGTPDCLDGCPNDPLKIETGLCGCGVPDLDSDADGVPDCQDACPNDPAKIAAGICGCGIPDQDLDEDSIEDCNDNLPGVFNPEQFDIDGDGVGDDPNSLIGLLQACGVCGTGVFPVLLSVMPILLVSRRKWKRSART